MIYIQNFPKHLVPIPNTAIQQKNVRSSPTYKEQIDAFYIIKRIYKQLASKNAKEQRLITSGMNSVISSPKRSQKHSSKEATKRKEPSSSQTPAFTPSKRSKSKKSQLPISADTQLVVLSKVDNTHLTQFSQKDVDIETGTASPMIIIPNPSTLILP